MKKIAFLEDAARSLTKNIDIWIKTRVTEKDPMMAEDIISLIHKHSLAAGAAAIGVVALPGAGSTVSMVTAAGIMWHMYLKINSRIGLKLSKVVLKSLATAVLSNLAQNALSVVGAVAVSGLLSLTGLGSVPAAVMMSALDYAITLVGGVIYLKTLTGLFQAGKNPENMTESEIKIAAEDTVAREHVGDMLREARQTYNKARKSGEFTGKETVDMNE